ncbi:MAG: amino acid transporter ATP-binding protein [Methylobacterium brachiatum]|nr:amino acid transporter ATP-binding protein [Methylobacterium brachiatum]
MASTPSPSWTPDQPIVRLADVYKSFGTFEVLKGISFDVRKGEVVCIIGPSGSGKSTLIRCVNALVPVTAGSIQVEGIEVTDPRLDKLALRRKVGMVFQQYNLFPHKTALQNVMMAPIHVLGQDRREVEARARTLLAKVRLAGKEAAYPGELVTIRELAEEGMTCMLVTHEMNFARDVADHIYFTDRGVIVEHGPPATFFASAQDERTRRFLSQVL